MYQTSLLHLSAWILYQAPAPTCMVNIFRLKISTARPRDAPLSSLIFPHASLPLYVLSESFLLHLSQVGP